MFLISGTVEAAADGSITGYLSGTTQISQTRQGGSQNQRGLKRISQQNEKLLVLIVVPTLTLSDGMKTFSCPKVISVNTELLSAYNNNYGVSASERKIKLKINLSFFWRPEQKSTFTSLKF